jgi:hypothetical protein
MAKSTYLQNALNNHVLDATAYTTPVTIYGGLWTVALTAAAHGGTAGEVTYTDYARVAVTNDGSKFAASAAGLISNSAAIAWPAPTGNGNAPIVSAGFFDGNAGTSADNLLYFDADTGSLTILDGDQAPSIASGAFDHQEG